MIMTVNSLAILLTDKCNFHCGYCYQWQKSGTDIDPLHAKRAVQYVLNNSGNNLSITFSGGEPLIKFRLMEKCMYYLKKRIREREKKADFSIITNGSLIDDVVLNFLNKNKFHVQFSFDVYLRNSPSEFEKFISGEKILKKLLNAEFISLSTNTVFTPDIADQLFRSVVYIHEQGVREIGIGIDQTADWNDSSLKILKEQLGLTGELILSEYRKSGEIISDYFAPKISVGINTCSASGGRLTLAPDGGLWGCASFHFLDWDHVRETKDHYYYGHVNDLGNDIFEKRAEVIKLNYAKFRTDHFKTESRKCFLCEYLQECRICPAQKYIYLKGKRSMFDIPEQVCEMNKIIIDANRQFQNRIGMRESN
jgi:radical SAM protein with 4Fe4S-binding SPASM domain